MGMLDGESDPRWDGLRRVPFQLEEFTRGRDILDTIREDTKVRELLGRDRPRRGVWSPPAGWVTVAHRDGIEIAVSRQRYRDSGIETAVLRQRY